MKCRMRLLIAWWGRAFDEVPVFMTTNRPTPSARTSQAQSPQVSRAVFRMNLFVFVPGRYMMLDLSTLSTSWLALCFPSALHRSCESSGRNVGQEGVVMLIVLSDGRLSDQDLRQFTTPIMQTHYSGFTDSMGFQRHFPFQISRLSSWISTGSIDSHSIIRSIVWIARSCEVF